MKKNEKLFKVVFKASTNSYQFWFTDHEGEFVFASEYMTFTKTGEEITSATREDAMVSENIIWRINEYVALGYRLVGVICAKEDNEPLKWR